MDIGVAFSCNHPKISQLSVAIKQRQDRFSIAAIFRSEQIPHIGQ